MANTLYIPRLNPVRFYEQSPAQFDEYLTRFMDDYRYADTILPWQVRKLYAQRWQTSDAIRIQVESTFDPLQLDIINKYGQVVNSLLAIQIIPNKYIPGTYVYEFTHSWNGYEPGCYLLRLSNGNPNEFAMVSEPQHVAVTHPNTVYIQYRNSRFHGDVVFETGIRFNFRVEASFGPLQPGARLQTYEDQKLNPTILSARPFRTWPLVIGGTFGVPDWVTDLVNLIWCCNEVSVDGKLFARAGDAELEFSDEDDEYPLRAITINLQEGLNRASKIVNPDINTNIKLVVVGVGDTLLFGDLSANSSSNLVPITQAG